MLSLLNEIPLPSHGVAVRIRSAFLDAVYDVVRRISHLTDALGRAVDVKLGKRFSDRD
jgi:hypothetical protein